MWLQYVCDSLTGAGTIAQWIHCGENEKPVIVHGGEGVDTTLLVTSLAQSLLDPDSRTVRGLVFNIFEFLFKTIRVLRKET